MLTGAEVRTPAAGGPRLADTAGQHPTIAFAPARVRFRAVYSRATARLFIIGGEDPVTHAPRGDIWYRSIDAGGGWGVVPALEFQPSTLLAATYSFIDGKLWILDSIPKNANKLVVRLSTVDPMTGKTALVGQWPRLKHYDAHWLLVDHDGSVLLVASSQKLRRHSVFRLKTTGSGALLLRTASGFLPWAPVVDLAGYGFVVQDSPSAAPRMVRVTGLGPVKPVSESELGSCL